MGAAEQLPQEGHEVPEHIAVSARQLRDQLSGHTTIRSVSSAEH